MFNNLAAGFAVASTILPAIQQSRGDGSSMLGTVSSSIMSGIAMNSFARGGILGATLGAAALNIGSIGGGALISAFVNQARTRPKYNMSLAAPWSGSYSPSERAYVSLRRGLDSITGGQSSLGSEASQYAARYSR